MNDVRYALRTLRRSATFSVTSIATLALALGATTAMLSVLNAVLLKPLPYESPDRLAMMWTTNPAQNLLEGRTAYWTVEQWRSQSESFADIAVFDPATATLTGADGAERISVARISAGFFSLLGVRPLHGRTFTDKEADSRQRLAVISHRFWRARFGGSPDAIGRSLVLDGQPSEIVGILPQSFRFAESDVWEPVTMFADWDQRREARGAGSWFVVGRLRAAVTVERAQQEMATIADRLRDELPAGSRNQGVSVVPLDVSIVGSRSRLALWMLTMLVGCVLLIAATNVASLSLARGIDRTPEIALRAVLGASPMRILRQLLAESVTLAAIAGGLGLVVAVAAIGFIRAFGPADLARLDETRLDVRVLMWAAAIAVLIGIVVGVAPGLVAWRRNLRPAGDVGARVAGTVAGRRLHRVLVAGECAIAMVLLVATGLLIRSWWVIQRIEPGFRPERVLSMQLSTTAFQSPAQRIDFYDRVLAEVGGVAGVDGSGIASDLFISNSAEVMITAVGDAGPVSERIQLRRDEVSPGFFEAVGTPLLKGRLLTSDDRPDSPRVAIVNDTMARRVWRGRDPVGLTFKLGPADSTNPWWTVVGVVADMRRQGLEREPFPQVFEAITQNPPRLATLLVRTSTDTPLSMAASVQAAVRRVDRYVPIYGVATLAGQLGRYAQPRRFQTALVLTFAFVGVFIAAIGIYGLLQYSVATRAREIGLRLALGAQRGEVFRMVAGDGLKLSGIGLAAGLLLAPWIGRAGRDLLFGVSATDPFTFGAVSVFLVVIATVACVFPARRAMKLDPIVVLRARP
jgi:putative ABC transport system permease protein